MNTPMPPLLAATAIATLAVASPAAANPLVRAAGPVAACVKSAPCSTAAKRKAKDAFENIKRKVETAADWASDVSGAVRDGFEAAGDSMKRSAKGRRADEVHRLHREALAQPHAPR